MARRAAEVGASFLAANPLFLKPCSRPTYLSFVREHFPSLQADYARRFDHADFAAPAYRQRLAQMVEQARRLHGLGVRPLDVMPQPGNTVRRPPESVGIAVQQSLFA
jgi:hypothetical protein